MKLNWMAKSTVVTAILYPTSLIVIRRSNGVTDAVLALAMLALMAFVIILLAEHVRLNAPLNNRLLVPGVSAALFGNIFLSNLIHKPTQPITIFTGAAFTVLLLLVVLVAWREKNKNGPNTRTR